MSHSILPRGGTSLKSIVALGVFVTLLIFVSLLGDTPKVALADQLTTPMQRHFNHIAFLGDSLTEGYYSSDPSKDFKAQFLSLLHSRDPQSAQNSQAYGIGGYRIQDLLTDLQQNPQKIPQNQDLLVLEMGTNNINDPAASLAQDQTNYAGIVSLLQQSSPNAIIMCLGVWGTYGTTNVTNVNTIVQTTCNNLNTGSDPNTPKGIYVDLTPLFANSSLRGPAGIPDPRFSPPTTDDFHPNDAGHLQIANLLLSALTSFLPGPAPATGATPAGYFRAQAAQSCDAVTGWATQDLATFSASPTDPNTVDFYANAPYGNAGSIYLGSAVANQDLGAPDPGIITYESALSGNTTQRYFSFSIPPIIRDGNGHMLYAYAIDTNVARNYNPLIGGGPISVTCAYPTPAAYFNQYTGSGNFSGWACQFGPGSYNRVDFYDGSGFSQFIGSAIANINTGDTGLLNIAQCESEDHYFRFTLPARLKDGKSHQIYGYVIDNSDRNQNLPVGGGSLSVLLP